MHSWTNSTCWAPSVPGRRENSWLSWFLFLFINIIFLPSLNPQSCEHFLHGPMAWMAIPAFLQFFPQRLGGTSKQLNPNVPGTAAPSTQVLHPWAFHPLWDKKSSRRLEKGPPWPPRKTATSPGSRCARISSSVPLALSICSSSSSDYSCLRVSFSIV